MGHLQWWTGFQAFFRRGSRTDRQGGDGGVRAVVDRDGNLDDEHHEMIFTSYTYLLFLTAAFIIHWCLPVSARKLFLVIASYVFYCSWKWQYGFLLLSVTLFNWTYARWVLARAASMWTLIIGISVNLAALIYFKYSNFFLANAATVSRLFGSHWHPTLLD